MQNDTPKLDFNNMIIAIGASTGGTEAILKILKELPKEMPPIVITQHMPKGFVSLYVQRIDPKCNLKIKLAEHGEFLSPGVVYIAPGGDFHTKILKIGPSYKIALINSEKVSGHKPSVDVLFSSVAKSAKNNSIGVILTGMGSDGAAGLLEIKQAGGYTIGQNEESCIVYGMPMVAKKMGAVAREVDLSVIPNLILSFLKKNVEIG